MSVTGSIDVAHSTDQVPNEIEVPVPLWSNLALPQQHLACVAHASYVNAWVDADVPIPSAFKGVAQKRREDDEAASTYRSPKHPQTKIIYDAFLSLCTLTVMQEEGDVKRLVLAEKAEFMAAVGKGETDVMAAPPRRYAMTLLIPQSSKCTERHQLLDCMALLSRASGMGEDCPAKVVRMSVLTDSDAIYYADKTDHHPLVGACNHAELALTHVTDDGKRMCKYLPLEHTNLTSKQMFKMLTKAVAQLFRDSKLDLLPSLARSSSNSSDTIDGAYRLSVQEANIDFWSLVSVHDKEPSMEHRLEFGWDGNPHHRVFLKIVPHLEMPHDHQDVYFGMLMYKEDMEADLYDYAVTAMQEERAAQPFAPKSSAFGLRPPATTKESACRPHVLTMRADTVSLRGQVSCFGLRMSPGADVSFYDNCSVPRLLYTLEPFNEEFRAGKYVFPCTQDQTDSKDRYEENKAQWEAAMDGLRKYGYVCNFTDDPPTPQETKKNFFHIKKRKSAPSGEDKVLTGMMGIPMGSAYRLGDVYEQVALVKQRVPVLASFLTASIARLGPNASMAEALQVCVRLEEERKALSAQVEKLRTEMQAAEDAAAVAAAAPPPKSVSASTLAEIEPCSIAQAEKLLFMMNLRPAGGTPLKLPLTTNRCIGLNRVLARANLTTEADENAARALAPYCEDLGVVEAACYLGAKIYGLNVYVVVVREVGAKVDVVLLVNDAPTKVSPLMMMEDAGDKNFPPLLLKFDEKQSKLFALIPKA